MYIYLDNNFDNFLAFIRVFNYIPSKTFTKKTSNQN